MSPTLRQRRRQAASVPSVSSLFSTSTGGLLRSWMNPAPQSAPPYQLSASTLPRLPAALLVRDRLLDRLNEWAPVTVLRGRTGTGKTTLVASWLAAMAPAEFTPLWVSGSGDGTDSDNFERTVGGDRQRDR